MAIWLIRAASHCEYEQKFISENRVYVTWDKLAVNLAKLPDRDALTTEMAKLYPDAKPKRRLNWVSQVWPFAHEIKKGDLVFLPLKSKPAICIGEVTGDYHFGQDILNSLGAMEITPSWNDALIEKRMISNVPSSSDLSPRQSRTVVTSKDFNNA